MTLIKLFELYNSSSHHSESQMANKTLIATTILLSLTSS